MIERAASTDLLLALALATFIVPAVFLAFSAFAAFRRRRGTQLGSVTLSALALTGGLSEGTLLLWADELPLALPLLLVAGVVTLGRWRAGQRRQAGWFLFGIGLPTVLVGVLAVVRPRLLHDPADPTWLVWLLAGITGFTIGAALILRGDPAPPAPAIDAPAGQPGSRSMGTIAAAIREPSFIGPFGMPELAMLVTFVAVWLIVPLALPAGTPSIARIGLAAVLGAVLGTEAYLRAMTTRTRRAFEAFSWLGEWELARARRATGGPLPTSPEQAARWLEGRPERPEERTIRIEILLLAGRLHEARRLVDRLPGGTPWERFEIAALRDLVDWRAGGDGDLPGMEEAAREILPRDGDERLRAEVTIAVARVRRLMAERQATPDEAVKPLLDVRTLLGRRADGQVGRALRPRIIPGLVLSGVVLGLVGEIFSQPV